MGKKTPVQEQRGSNGKRRGGSTGKGFVPGQSGNPGGRPKGESITAALRRKLQEEQADGRTKAEAVADVLIREALDGNYQFAREVVDRSDGKVPDRIAGADGGVLKVVVEYADGPIGPAPAPSGPDVDPGVGEPV